MLGPEAIVGLSTHSEEQIAAAAEAPVDYISVGPVWETPTKAGRPGGRPRAVAPRGRARRRIPSSRSAASTPATPREVVAAGRRAARASCGRSATPTTRRPRPSELRRAFDAPAERGARWLTGAARAPRGARGERPSAPPSARRRRGWTRGYAKAEERNQEAREALEPLAEGERPRW